MRTIMMIILTVALTATPGAGAVMATPENTDGAVPGITADPDHSTTPETEFVGELGIGDALFWDGPYLERVGDPSTRQTDPVLCHSPASTMPGCAYAGALVQPTLFAADVGKFLGAENPFCGRDHACFTYTFDVTEPGEVLRVALDQQSRRDYMFVDLHDPDGALVARLWRWEAEWFVPAEVGRWTARVEVFDARDTSFRLRAALDPDSNPQRAGDRVAQRRSEFLLPNLQMVPPFELGFGPCQATEIAHYSAQRCLRFSTGPANTGDGPLDLVVPDTGSLAGPMYQRLHRADGSTETVPAGDYEYHTEHLHYHHDAIASLELYRVTDPRRGGLEPAGEGPKLGFCLLPLHIAEWYSFAQDPPYSVYEDAACSGDEDPPLPAQMALARGWLDIYPWFVEGNFVDFGDNPDGLYVIRVASNPDGQIHETRNDDNHAYTYIRVTGDDIEVLERGRGHSPWDPPCAARRTTERCRQVVDDTRRPLRWQE